MARLGDICKIKSGYAFRSESFSNVGVPVVRIGNITSDGINVDYSICYDTAFWNDNSNYRVEKNDILVAMSGATVGKACINTLNIPLLLNQRVASIVCDNPITQKYVYHAINSDEFLKYVIDNSAGCAQPNISAKQLANFQLKVSDLRIQERIVTVLDGLSHIIYLRKQQLSKLDELVKSRFIEMFGNSEHNTMNWPTAKLSTLCDVGSSKRIYQSELTENGIPFLRISDLNERIDGEYNEPQLFIPNERFNELKSNGLVPSIGDILVTARGTLGRCYIIKAEDNFYFQDGMISWLSDISENITSLYISELFATTGVQKQIANLQAGSTVAYLSIAMLKKLDIMMPPKALQQQFAAFVEQIDKSKFEIQQSLEKIEILKKALMQKYFG